MDQGLSKNSSPVSQNMTPSNTDLSNTRSRDLDTTDTDSSLNNDVNNKQELKEKHFKKARLENH